MMAPPERSFSTSSPAVPIHHTIAGFPRALQFKPLRLKPRDVLEHLRTLGYPVA